MCLYLWLYYEKGRRSSVLHVHIHPDYDKDKNENDIAILKLETCLSFDKTVQPACLPESLDFTGSNALFSGLGKIVGSKNTDLVIIFSTTFELNLNNQLLPKNCCLVWFNLRVFSLPKKNVLDIKILYSVSECNINLYVDMQNLAGWGEYVHIGILFGILK